MKNLKHIIHHNMRRLIAFMVVLVLLAAVLFQILAAQAQARQNAEETFAQVGQILHENNAELDHIIEEYRQTCLLNAEVIAYIVEQNPDILGNIEEFRLLARKLQVDEIHIFDQTGCIFTGTHPEYFNYTFETGEQIGYFKPLLQDKSLRLCQDITPNTAEGKMVQYSALWSANGRFIVQVGMYPEAVFEVTEKNELSYIFSLLQGNPGVTLYAVDAASGEIIGSTAGNDNGRQLVDLGFPGADIVKFSRGSHMTINGVDSYCTFTELDDMLIGYVISNDQLYGHVAAYTLFLAVFLLVIAIVLMHVVQKFNDFYIIDSISAINAKLHSIAEGNLDEQMNVTSSLEFAELSNYINQMIRSLLATTDKMSLVLNRTNMPIGVYEYNPKMKTARFTEHIPALFGLSTEELATLSTDQAQLRAFIDRLRSEPVPMMESTYRLSGNRERYIKLEEITGENEVLGIVVDVTKETQHMRRLQTERDIDLLTGLNNRRAMEHHFEHVFTDYASMNSGALIAIDSDNLKDINDTYGHSTGDLYLKALANLLRDFNAPQQFAARYGGDEFVLLIYGYSDDDAVIAAIDTLHTLRDNATICLEDGTVFPLRFSFGYTLTRGRCDYDIMLSTADGHMYASKRERKKALR